MANTIKMRVGTETIDVPENASDAELRALTQASGTIKQGTTTDQTKPEPTLPSEAMQSFQSGLETSAPYVLGSGAAIGAGIATGGNPIAASAAGAGGAAIGELAPLLRPLTTGEPAPSFHEIGQEAAKTGLFSIMADLVTAGILSPLGRFMGAKFTHVDEPVGAGVEATLRTLEKRGSTLTAGQLEQLRDPMSDRLVKTAETVAYNSLTSRRVNRTYSDQQQIGNDLMDELSTRLAAMPDSDVSALLTNEVKYQFDNIVRPVRHAMYKKAFDLMPGPVVPTGDLKKELFKNEAKAHWQKVIVAVEGDKDSYGAALSSLDASGKFAIDRISLEDAVRMRSDLSKLAHKKTEDDAVRNTAGRMAKLMNDAIDQAVPPAPKGLSGAALTSAQGKMNKTALEARHALDAADQYFGETQDMFRNKLLRKTAEKLAQEPGKLENVLLASNSVDTIKAWREAYGEKLFDKDIQPRLTAAFLAGTKQADGTWDTNVLWTKLRAMGEETGKAAFGKARYKELHELANFFEHINTRAAGKLGIAVSLLQAGMVGGVLGLSPLDKPGKAAGTLLVTLTPTALGHLVANPELLRSFRRGLQMSWGAGRPVPYFTETMKKLAAVSASHSFPLEFGTGQPDQNVLQPEKSLSRGVDRTGRTIPTLQATP